MPYTPYHPNHTPTCVVTRACPDGTFDSIGGNNRTIARLKTKRGVLARVVRCQFAKHGDHVRLEWYRAPYDPVPYYAEYGFVNLYYRAVPSLIATRCWQQEPVKTTRLKRHR